MSEYQYYEFQAIDRPLTEEEQALMRQLSSRVALTPTSAAFTYNYGDFRGNPRQVLAQHFDAMLYLTNWGSKQLLFRFPQALIDIDQVKPYGVEEMIFFTSVDQYIILNIQFFEEEGGDWIDGEGWLPSLLPLRNDLLQQDYRLLYLAWLKAIPFEDIADFVQEPPVPAGLGQLPPALRNFIDLFEIDEYLIQAAAEASPPLTPASPEQLRQALGRLSGEERDNFLLRLAQGEPHLTIELNRRLQKLAGQATSGQPKPKRTVGQLFQRAQQVQAEAHHKQAAEAEAKRIQELKALAQREDQTWQEVETLIQKSQSKAYDEAVQLLVKLRDLALYQGQEATFQQRLNWIYNHYSNRSALMRRLRDVGLYQV
jgi:hypothetical protein